MKRALVPMLLAMLFGLSTLNQASAETISTTFEVEPSPMIAGHAGFLILTMTSMGGDATDVRTWIAESDIPYLKETIRVGDIKQGDSEQVIFELDVPENFPDGTYRVKVKIMFDDQTISRYAIVEVVNPRKKILLDIENVHTDKAIINPGDFFTLRVGIVNLGSETARDVRVAWALEGAFVPHKSDTQAYLGTIEPENQRVARFEILVDKDADPRAYPINLTIFYADEDGAEQAPLSQNISVVVGGPTEFFIDIASSTKIEAGSTSDLTIVVANTGSGDANSLILTLKAKPPIDVVGPNEVYMGTVKMDDFDTARFSVSVDEAANPGLYPLRIDLTYKDPLGVKRSLSEEFQLEIPSRAAPPVPGGLGFLMLPIMVAVVAAALGVYIRLRRK